MPGKVAGGTPVGGSSLCETCRHARIVRGYADSECIVICDRYWRPMRVPFVVRECSSYDDKRLPDVEDMEEIALILRSKQPGREAGFSGPGFRPAATDKDEQEDETTAARDQMIPPPRT